VFELKYKCFVKSRCHNWLYLHNNGYKVNFVEMIITKTLHFVSHPFPPGWFEVVFAAVIVQWATCRALKIDLLAEI